MSVCVCVTSVYLLQELCYLCMQRSQRNVPLYLQEERRREEQEANRGLLIHQQLRDQAYLQRERVRHTHTLTHTYTHEDTHHILTRSEEHTSELQSR